MRGRWTRTSSIAPWQGQTPDDGGPAIRSWTSPTRGDSLGLSREATLEGGEKPGPGTR